MAETLEENLTETVEAENKEKPRILIVDDVEANRLILKDIILDMGYMPVLTENGVQALKFMEHCVPQLIILDVAMPKMDGYEFCTIVKNNPDVKEIPIIFISAFDEPVDIVKGFNVGGEDYITKPFIPEVVKARVGLHLKLYETNRNITRLNHQLHVTVQEQLRQLENEKKKVLYALGRVAKENASYDVHNMERLSFNCRLLAEAMQLSPNYSTRISDAFIDTIEIAAPLCDFGNISIPTSILQKEDELTEEETLIMQKHTLIGTRILQDVRNQDNYNEFTQMTIDIVHYHHENWDGSGYPEGIKGEEIPLAAQIVAVVANFCALTEDRTYRESMTKRLAIEEMEQDSGIKFNPEIYEILKKIHRQLQ
jgi:putative two-component system response regulator